MDFSFVCRWSVFQNPVTYIHMYVHMYNLYALPKALPPTCMKNTAQDES